MGPTGSGKSAAAIGLAKAGYPIRVINTDSRQVYKDFPIISAAPDAEERSACPHELYTYLETTEKNSAGEWIELAKERIEEAHAHGFLPALVGGTGFYFKALLDGIAEIPAIPENIHQKYIAECERLGSEALYARLKEIDPNYASKIHFNDKQRVARALEVYEATGKTFSAWHENTPQENKYDIYRLGIGLPLAELTPFLYKRTEIMLERGALEEAEHALTICPDTNAPGWSGIGCRELADYILGKSTKEECMLLWNKNTRAYAKRQWTWFKADTRINWFRPEQDYFSELKKFIEKA